MNIMTHTSLHTITETPSFVSNDGGRSAAGYKGDARDCVVRAISIAAELDYQFVYDGVNAMAKSSVTRKGVVKSSVARKGVPMKICKQYLHSLGWTWVPTMKIGQGCKTHLTKDELPSGRVIASVSKHLVAVIDGVIHDTHDCSRAGRRCVYGYFVKNPM